ncbi:hypothetical protein EJB05_23398, partial [Eragrostis curvula]
MFKGIATGTVGDGRTILLWDDCWEQRVPRLNFPHLHSYTNRPNISPPPSFTATTAAPNAYQQYQELNGIMGTLDLGNQNDIWTYIWGSAVYSSSKAYRHLMGHQYVPAPIKWIWKSSCQMKHKVFFWLLLNDKLHTRGRLRRRNMFLDSYTCDLCILQREETLRHLFLKCNFARACWDSIGLHIPGSAATTETVKRLKRQLNVNFYMEVIILMSWSIWQTRNNWIFNNIDPTIEGCRQMFKKEMLLVVHRAKQKYFPALTSWIENL